MHMGDLLRCVENHPNAEIVGICDPRPERIASFNWKRSSAPTAEALIDELAGAGVSRIVLSHGGNASESAAFASLAARQPTMELSVAGGVSDLDGVRRLHKT